MTTKAYVKRIIDCANSMVENGEVSNIEELRMKYGLPAFREDVLSNESEESINKIIDVLSEKNPAARIYIQTGARSKIIDNSQIQVGHGNLYGNNNKMKESSIEEDCCVKLERALVEIKYLKKSLEDKEKELTQKDALISELINKIK